MKVAHLGIFALLVTVVAAAAPSTAQGEDGPLDYHIELLRASSGYDGKTCWVHARAGAIPPRVPGNPADRPQVLMTMQKLLLTGSDVFYPLHSLRTDDLGHTWTEPKLEPVFARQKMGEDVEMTVCDFWPAWHTATGKLLGTGHTVWYKGDRVMPVRQRHAAYAV